MPLLGFSVYKEEIKTQIKKQTIRIYGAGLKKHPIRENSKLYLYWHLRQPDCEKLGDSKCSETFLINMLLTNTQKSIVVLDFSKDPQICLSQSDIEDLAKRDGFQNAQAMFEWFSKVHGDSSGKIDDIFQVIRWEELIQPTQISNTGLECSAILYIQEHGKKGWDYAFANYCDNCKQIDHCNIVNGSVKITKKGIEIMKKILEEKK